MACSLTSYVQSAMRFWIAVAVVCLIQVEGLANDVREDKTKFMQAVPKHTQDASSVVEVRTLENVVKQPLFSTFSLNSDFKGILLYAFDTSRYGSSGFSWPWESYLVLHHYDERGKGKNKNQSTFIESYQVVTTQWQFLHAPQFSPDGQHIAFKVGDPNRDSGTFGLYIWNRKVRKLQAVADGKVGQAEIVWSPDSRYLAYVEGAVARLPSGWVVGKLHIFDTTTQKDVVVSEREPMTNSIVWTTNNRLLFNAQPTAQPKGSPDAKATHEEFRRFDVLEVAPTGGEAKIAIHDAFLPSPSPDGRWVAFFGFEPLLAESGAEKAADKTSIAIQPLTLLDKATGKRLVLPTDPEDEKPGAIFFRWQPDSRQLIIIKTLEKAPHEGQARISRYDPITHTRQLIGSVEYKIDDGMDVSLSFPLLKPLAISRDCKYLFVRLMQFDKMPNNGLFLKAVNLKDGTISTLCRIGSVSGLDWHDESVAEPPASTRAKDKAKVK